jgi:hypothetical protein
MSSHVSLRRSWFRVERDPRGDTAQQVDAVQYGGDKGGKPTSTGRREGEAVPVPGAPARGFDLVTHWRGQRPRRGSVQVPHLWRDRVEEALEGGSRNIGAGLDAKRGA